MFVAITVRRFIICVLGSATNFAKTNKDKIVYCTVTLVACHNFAIVVVTIAAIIIKRQNPASVFLIDSLESIQLTRTQYLFLNRK